MTDVAVFLFLTVWANNGDAISRSYAGTSALKGDFTRSVLLSPYAFEVRPRLTSFGLNLEGPASATGKACSTTVSTLSLGCTRQSSPIPSPCPLLTFEFLAHAPRSAFSDFWTQAVIDFALGHRGVNMFTSEYMEKMSTAEPANLLRLSIIRSEASVFLFSTPLRCLRLPQTDFIYFVGLRSRDVHVASAR